MNSKGFRALLRAPSWSKDVVVWAGNGEALRDALENKSHVELDLLDLFPEDEQLPPSREGRAELLKRKLDDHLQQLRPTGPGHVILRVRNAPLLARYGLGLQSFYDWFGGSQTLAVIELNRLKPMQLPSNTSDTISFDPDWLVDYFRPLLAKPDNLCAEVE